MPRYFTLQEAEGVLPLVKEYLESAIDAKARIGTIDGELQALSSRISLLGGIEINPDRIARQKLERAVLIRAIEDAVDHIQSSGCLVKDLDRGLLDFPALLNGVEVFLCWKLGETKIEWWHTTDEGFAGRKRILNEFDIGGAGLRPN